MSHEDSTSGSRRSVPNKFKWAIRHFPPHCGRNARRLSEEERRQFLASRRESLDNEKPSQKEIMSRIGSSSGSSHLVLNKSKSLIRDYPLYCGRNAPHQSEGEPRQLLASRREGLERERTSLKQKDILKIKDKDMAGSSNKVAAVTDRKDSKRKCVDLSLHQLPEKMENQSSSGLSNLYPSGHNHKLSKFDYRNESYRKRVVEAVSTFRDICNQLSKDKLEHDGEMKVRRMDCFAAKLMKEKGMYVHAGMKFVGCVPGVKLGDRFIYRMELAVVGLHSPPVAGIDYASENGHSLATSVVASKGYADDLQKPNELIYIGEGGMPSRKNKVPEDQKLVRGNLALMNSLRGKTPVRVIRQEEEVRTKAFEYVYDGLYLVESVEKVPWTTGQLVFKFVLKRSSDQEYVRPFKVKK